MAGGVVLEWAQFGHFDSFDVYRSSAPMDAESLPAPLVTNIKTMRYVDTSVVIGETYYYRVAAWLENDRMLSQEIEAIASANYDPYWENVVSLLHFEEDFKDETGRLWLPQGAPAISSDEFAFGSNSLFISGGDRNGLLGQKSADFAISTDDFTIEMFVFCLDENDRVFIEIGTGSGWYGRFWIDRYQGKLSIAGGPSVSRWVHSGDIPLNEWVHIAACIKSNNIYGFVNGKLVGSSNVSGQLPTGDLIAGIGYVLPQANNANMRGYIDELRITKGVARYTENFTPPTEPFPNG